MNGCTLTVEDAIVTRTGVALIYSFRYADGSPFPTQFTLKRFPF